MNRNQMLDSLMLEQFFRKTELMNMISCSDEGQIV